MDYDVVYSGALERAYIQSQQQRPAPPLPEPPPRHGHGRPQTSRIAVLRPQVGALLRAKGTWLSAPEIARELADEPRRVGWILNNFVRAGHVRRERAIKGMRRAVQRYRWRT